MTKIEYVSIKQPKPARSPSVTTKRVRGTSGEFVTVYTVDADSRTFGDDLTYVFKQNVKKARSASKR
jgi:hypothetical protein